jgi:hypothetical protein
VIREEARPNDELAPALGVLVVALVMTGMAIYGFLRVFPNQTDFRARYNEGIAWRHQSALYTLNPSLNTHPPVVTALFFAPLSRLPYPVAQVVSTGMNLVAVIASLRLIARTLDLSATQTVWASGLLLGTQGMFQHWAMGQFIGILLYPVTRAWMASRGGDDLEAGLWLAPVIFVKPPLALLAILLPWGTWVTAGTLSAFASGLGVLMTGAQPWLTWLKAGSEINWLALPLNASLWGMAARWQQGDCSWFRMADLSVASTAAVLSIGGGLAWHALRQRDRDRRFFFAGLWSVLLAPLGWVYYLPLVAGAATASWPRSWIVVVAYGLLLAPAGENLPDASLMLGSFMFVGVACSWLAWTLPTHPVPGAGDSRTREPSTTLF